MRAPAGGADLDAQRALAAGLDLAVGGLAEQREVRGQPVGQVALDPAEPVARGLDLLVVVEHERQVVPGLATVAATCRNTASPAFMSLVPQP